jgi:hypothetical protein
MRFRPTRLDLQIKGKLRRLGHKLGKCSERGGVNFGRKNQVVGCIDQPATRREYKPRTTAKNSQLSPVQT